MRVLLVDDNSLYLEGLRCLLQENGIEVAGTASDGLDALNKVEMLKPDVILMDVEMSGCGGIDATAIIKRDYPWIEIVMLSVSQEDEHLFNAIRAGASGYLLKSMDAGMFLAKLKLLFQGDAPFAPQMARRILREVTAPDQSLMRCPAEEDGESVLTERQLEVLRMLAQGRTYREIGLALEIREITVRYHVNELMRKLHLANRSQLIAYASKLNL